MSRSAAHSSSVDGLDHRHSHGMKPTVSESRQVVEDLDRSRRGEEFVLGKTSLSKSGSSASICRRWYSPPAPHATIEPRLSAGPPSDGRFSAGPEFGDPVADDTAVGLISRSPALRVPAPPRCSRCGPHTRAGAACTVLAAAPAFIAVCACDMKISRIRRVRSRMRHRLFDIARLRR